MFELYLYVFSKRYLFREISYRQRPLNKFLIDLNLVASGVNSQPWLNEVEFMSAYRMTRKAFCGVICMIQNSAVFQTTNETNNRGRRQYPVEYQMMTFLHLP